MLTASRQQAFDQAMAHSLSGESYAVISYSIPDEQVETYLYRMKEYPADMPWYALRDELPLPGCLIMDVKEFGSSTVPPSSR